MHVSRRTRVLAALTASLVFGAVAMVAQDAEKTASNKATGLTVGLWPPSGVGGGLETQRANGAPGFAALRLVSPSHLRPP